MELARPARTTHAGVPAWRWWENQKGVDGQYDPATCTQVPPAQRLGGPEDGVGVLGVGGSSGHGQRWQQAGGSWQRSGRQAGAGIHPTSARIWIRRVRASVCMCGTRRWWSDMWLSTRCSNLNLTPDCASGYCQGSGWLMGGHGGRDAPCRQPFLEGQLDSAPLCNLALLSPAQHAQ